MKKLLGIVVLGLFWFNNVLADVYYCLDKAATGFSHENGNYKVANYSPRKFKAKIDFEKGILSSKDLYTVDLYCTKISSHKYSMTCSSMFGEVFTIEGDIPTIDIFNYVRAETYGRTDSILTAHGNCEKF